MSVKPPPYEKIHLENTDYTIDYTKPVSCFHTTGTDFVEIKPNLTSHLNIKSSDDMQIVDKHVYFETTTPPIYIRYPLVKYMTETEKLEEKISFIIENMYKTFSILIGNMKAMEYAIMVGDEEKAIELLEEEDPNKLYNAHTSLVSLSCKYKAYRFLEKCITKGANLANDLQQVIETGNDKCIEEAVAYSNYNFFSIDWENQEMSGNYLKFFQEHCLKYNIKMLPTEFRKPTLPFVEFCMSHSISIHIHLDDSIIGCKIAQYICQQQIQRVTFRNMYSLYDEIKNGYNLPQNMIEELIEKFQKINQYNNFNDEIKYLSGIKNRV